MASETIASAFVFVGTYTQSMGHVQAKARGIPVPVTAFGPCLCVPDAGAGC